MDQYECKNNKQTTQQDSSEANNQLLSKPSIPHVPQQQQQQQQLKVHHNNFKRLIGACKQKDLATIRSILNEQPELINQRDRYNRNVLHYTVILFRKQRQDELPSMSSSLSMSQDKRQTTFETDLDESIATATTTTMNPSDDFLDDARISQNLDCFNYLLDRCNQKLWWQQDLDGLSLLHLAVISSNQALVKYIIYEHPYSIKYPLVCRPDNERHSPLHWAVITNNLDCVRLLINSPSAGVNLIHEPDFNGATPLHYATQTNDYPKYRRQLKQMLRNVANDCQEKNQSPEQTAAAAVAVAATTTTKGINDQQSSSQQTTTKRRQRLMETDSLSMQLNSAGNERSRQGCHCLEILETFVKTPQVNIECRDKDRRTPLLWAASSGNRDAVLLLIGAGANPQSCDINKLGALHCAASHGFTECLESLLSVDKRGSSTIGLVLESGRSVNQPDNLNCTPIFYAVLSGNIDCVELLAERGAQLDWQDSKGRSAAHFAALRGQLNSLKLLQRRGANLWLANRQGDLPLHYAIKGGRHQVARWLLDHSPYENSVNAINNFGRAPIHLAIQRDDSELLDHLIKRGANLNQLVKVKDRHHHHQQQQQQVAALNGHLSKHHRSATSQSSCSQSPETTGAQTRDNSLARGSCTTLPSSDSITKLRGAATSTCEYHYETALDMAKKLGHDSSLRLLIDNGAKPAVQVMNGRIAHTGANVRSLFELQSIEGPSPIGFDTSSSSAVSPNQVTAINNNKAALVSDAADSVLPKLSRPRPESLPHSDSSGGSSALSQNSMTSVRGFPSKPPAGANNVAGSDRRRPFHFQHQHQVFDEEVAEAENNATTTRMPRNDTTTTMGQESKPFKGGISYNNERINASIKCKLYDNQHSFPPFYANNLREETNNDQSQQQSIKRDHRRHQSAPNHNQLSSPAQEIITNVNVYTSPCPLSHQQMNCAKCSAPPPASASAPATTATGTRNDRVVDHFRRSSKFHSSSPPTEEDGSSATSEGPATETSCDEEVNENNPRQQQQQQQWSGDHQSEQQVNNMGPMSQIHRAPPAVINSKQQHQQQHFGGGRCLPPNREAQQLPVILSEREEVTTSGETSINRSPEVAAGMEQPAQQQQQQQQQQQEITTGSQFSPAREEPRFDRSERGGGHSRPSNNRQHHIKSPVGEYIKSNTYQQLDSHMDTDHYHHHHHHNNNRQCFESHHLPDFSQVKPKVDTHRQEDGGAYRDRTSRSLSRQQVASKQQAAGVCNKQQQAPTSRSLSRQTFTREPPPSLHQHQHPYQHQLHHRQGSQDSFEFELEVERSIRKYKQEKRLFEELQGLKRSQIRSGRANEAVLVKRLVEHLRREQLAGANDLLGMDNYTGPYTYKSYERFLYDQLRKLSQSNCAKLSKSMRDFEQELRINVDNLYNNHENDNNNDDNNDEDVNADADADADADAEQHRRFLEEDLRADLELRRVIEGDTGSNLDEIGEPTTKSEKEHEIVESVEKVLSTQKHQSQEEMFEKLGKEVQEPKVRRASVVSIGSNASSRRSSIDIEKDRLKSLPLKTSDELGDGNHPDQQAPPDEDTKSMIEDEANSMCSAIMVDALGNLKTRSPVQSESNRSIELVSDYDDADADADGKDHQNDIPADTSQIREDSSKVDGVVNEGPGELSTSSSTSDTSEQTRARRRSVVNIGNKLEVIYHDVGIEIDPAGEPSAEEEPTVEEKQQGDDGQAAKSSEGTVKRFSYSSERSSEPPAMEDVKEETDEEEPEAEAKVDGKSEDDIGLIASEDTVTEQSQKLPRQSTEENKEGKYETVSKAEEDTQLKIVEERAKTAIRRASSPPGDIGRPKSPSSARRLSSIESSLLAKVNDGVSHVSELKRVFNGYDLDELHNRRGARGPEAGDVAGEQSGSSRTATDDSKTSSQISQNKSVHQTKKTGGVVVRRAKRERSRLPGNKFIPHVDVEQIKQRWSRVKAIERRRRMEGNQEDSFEQISYLAKSQPNLLEQQQQRQQQQQQKQEHTKIEDCQSKRRPSTVGAERQNYELLYEINTRSRQAEKGDIVRWCQRKVVKIVDVRCLKRTLSLPESVIYSNDLLKRFNILKL